MKTNKRSFVSGAVCIYIISVIFYYEAWIFFLGKKMDAFSIPQFAYVLGGALFLYFFYCAGIGRFRRKMIVGMYVSLSLLYAAGVFVVFSQQRKIEICVAGLCLCLAYCGKNFDSRTLEKVSAITRFELTSIILLLTMITIELKNVSRANMTLIVMAVVMSLTEVTRSSFLKKRQGGRVERLTGVILLWAIASSLYIVTFVSAVILIKEKQPVLRGLSFLAGIFKQAGKVLGDSIAGFFEYVADRLAGGGVPLILARDAGHAYVKEGVNTTVLFVIVIITIMLLLCAAIWFGLAKHRRKSTRRLRKKEKAISCKNHGLTAEEKEIRHTLMHGVRKYKLLAGRAKEPRVFLHKAAWICRRSEYRMKVSDSPRGFLERLLNEGVFHKESEGLLEQMAEAIDQYYYSASSEAGGYRREQGEKLLKELKLQTKKKKRRSKK